MRLIEGLTSAAIVLGDPIKWTPTGLLNAVPDIICKAQDPSTAYGLYKAERLVVVAAAAGAGPDAGKILSVAEAPDVFPDCQAGQKAIAICDYVLEQPD